MNLPGETLPAVWPHSRASLVCIFAGFPPLAGCRKPELFFPAEDLDHREAVMDCVRRGFLLGLLLAALTPIIARGQERRPAAPHRLPPADARTALRFAVPAGADEILPLPEQEPLRRADDGSAPPSPATNPKPASPQPKHAHPAEPRELTFPEPVTPAEPAHADGTAGKQPGDGAGERHQHPIGNAPAERGMTLAEIETIALRNNPSLVQAGAEVDAARGRFVQAGLYPNPVGMYSGSEIGNDGHGGQQGAGFEQQVVMGGKLRLARQVAAREVERVEHLFTAQRMRVLTDARRQFYSVLVAQQMQTLTGELVRISQEATRAADVLFKNQEASRVDLLQAQVELQTAQINADNANNRYLSAWRSLSSVLGMPELAPQTLSGSLLGDVPQLGWEEALQTLVTTSPELAAARANVAKSQWAIRQAQAVPIPDVTLQGIAQYDNASQYTIAGAQIGLPIPFFNRNQGGIAAAQSESIAAQANLNRLELALRQRLAGVFERYDNARRQVARYEGQILPQSKESLQLIVTGYQQGEFSYLSLLTAQRTFFQANLSYLNSVQELRSNSVAIQGLLLDGSLGETP